MLKYLAPLGLLFSTPIHAQDVGNEAPVSEDMGAILQQRAQDAVDVFSGDQKAEDVFDPSFLSQIPPEQIAAIGVQLTGQFGALEGVESVTQAGPDRAAIVLRFEKALGSGGIAVNPAAPHRITELLVSSFEAKDDNLSKIRLELEALPGEVGVLFTVLEPDAAPILAINPDQQFAVGSTFKLYILSALARSIEAGERSWSDVILIDRKSFPSGRMQNWPDGSPVTLHTLATMMISISDNTATDLLLRELGRDTVEQELLSIGHSDPERTLPFLSTLEMFALKGSPGNLRKYVFASEADQRRILADFEDDVGGNRSLVTPPRFVEPTEIDTVEWFASGQDLQKLAKRLSEIEDPTAREIMSVSKAMPADIANDWSYVGYKGGSEPGVLNLTWLLKDKAGWWHMLAMSWNNSQAVLDNSQLEILAQRLLPMAF